MTEGIVVAEVVRAVAAALLHSIWQGCIIAALLAVTLRALRGAPAQARYAVSCAALVAMFGAWLLTARAVAVAGRPPAAAAEHAVAPPVGESGAPAQGDTTPAIRIFAPKVMSSTACVESSVVVTWSASGAG